MRTGKVIFRALLIVTLAIAGVCIGNRVYSQTGLICTKEGCNTLQCTDTCSKSNGCWSGITTASFCKCTPGVGTCFEDCSSFTQCSGKCQQPGSPECKCKWCWCPSC